MNDLAIATNAVTMTSIELVEFINSQRKEGESELRHDNFMSKVPKVLGEECAPNFLGTQKYGNNNTRDIYTLPKREACLMAMSYSYELQAKVFDRMTELESKAVVPVRKVSDPRLAALIESLERLDVIEQEQREQAAKTKDVEAQTLKLTERLDQIETASDHFTVLGYFRTIKASSVHLTQAATIGKRLSKLCKERKIDIGSVPDPRFGRVNTYPRFLLDEVMEEIV